jgi:hypothetical protein
MKKNEKNREKRRRERKRGKEGITDEETMICIVVERKH